MSASKIVLFTIAALVAACAPIKREPVDLSWRDLTPQESSDLGKAVTCVGQERCAAMWRKAQTWIVNNSGWKIQIASDGIVQTYGPTDAGTMAYRLTRRPLPDGSEVFELAASCGRSDTYQCRPIITPEKARAAFAAYMRE